MKCPLCSENLNPLDEPDETIRGYCCACDVMVAVYELPSRDEVCSEEEEDEISELKRLVEEEEDKD